MTDFILVVILATILGAAIVYIVKAKKKGAKCIGCPVEGGCPHKQKHTSCSSTEGQCSCHTEVKNVSEK